MQLKKWFGNKVGESIIEDGILLHHVSVPIFIFNEHRNGYRSSFTKKGLYIRLPLHLPKAERQKIIDKCKNWAKERVNENPNLVQRYKSKVYKNGHEIQCFDTKYVICIRKVDRKSIKLKVIENHVHVILPLHLTSQDLTSKHFSKLFANHYRTFLEKRLQFWNGLFPVSYNTLRLKYNSSNWGSCSSKKNINLSTRLLLCPLPVIDYVMVHELAHLIHPNHSRAFWKEVEGVLPDYKESVHWLKTKGAYLDF